MNQGQVLAVTDSEGTTAIPEFLVLPAPSLETIIHTSNGLERRSRNGNAAAAPCILHYESDPASRLGCFRFTQIKNKAFQVCDIPTFAQHLDMGGQVIGGDNEVVVVKKEEFSLG